MITLSSIVTLISSTFKLFFLYLKFSKMFWLESKRGQIHTECIPEVLCAVLVREPLWLEARMDDQALLEGIVVFSDEDGPRNEKREGFIIFT